MLSIDFFLAFFIVGVLGFEAGEILAWALGEHLPFALVTDLKGWLFGGGRDALGFGSNPIEEHNILLKLFQNKRPKAKQKLHIYNQYQIER